MLFKIIVSPVASKNIEDALKYYTEISKNVGIGFLKDYRKIYKALKINPFYQFHDNNYRFIPFEKYPYSAFFIVDEKTKMVYLNAVFHTSQDPEKYPKLN